MNLAQWITACERNVWKLPKAERLEFWNMLERNGSQRICGKRYEHPERCNPWECSDCIDGMGLSCGYGKMADWYYVPDPYSRDKHERRNWWEFKSQMPKRNRQLTITF